MLTIYSLSDKGARASRGWTEGVSLPAELRQLLHMVDGRRTRQELIAALHKSAIVAGGLRWLEAAGYIKSKQQSAPAAGAITAENASDADKVQTVLSRHMLRAVRLWLNEDDQPYRQQIESAASVEQLLPLLNPLADHIVARAGVQAGVDFAENAALILERLVGRADGASS
ncbi:MAG: hypothetical protein LBI48_12555 [Burkholderiaceae bacterium]|jgi:hypothetical protein|nr:hypothetical protein [Burkholderiaceae bacterium]